jgi:hypothetical protein
LPPNWLQAPFSAVAGKTLRTNFVGSEGGATEESRRTEERVCGVTNNLAIRIFLRSEDGKLHDGNEAFEISDFGGILPSTGDMILNPGVLQGRDRRKLEHREIWTVVDRVFNPRDLKDCIVLIVEQRHPEPNERALLPPG